MVSIRFAAVLRIVSREPFSSASSFPLLHPAIYPKEYGEVAVTAAADDPTVCLVEFSFAVAHGLNQIRLTVHLTV